MRHKIITALTGVSFLTLMSLSSAWAQSITLRALMEDVPETDIIEKLLPEFERETGIKVEFEKVGYGDMHDKLVTQLVSSQSYYNLMEIDFLWAGEFPAAGWLVDLKFFIERDGFDMAAFIPATWDLLARTDDHIPIIPMYNYSMGLLYRSDLLADPALGSAYQAQFGRELALPQTLESYVELAKFMKDNAGIAGAAMQAQRGDPNALEFSNYLFSSGGSYLDESGQVTLESEAGIKALTLYVDAVQNAAQQGALSATLDDTMRLMCQGEAFSMISYWWMLPQVDNEAQCPAVAGKIGLSVMPGGHGESGGWGWGIAHNTPEEEQEAAWKFIQWVQSEEIAVRRALEGHAPVSEAVFRNEQVLQKYPFYETALDVVATAKSFPIFTYSAQYEDVLGTHLSRAAGGEIAPEAAIKAAAEGLRELLQR